MSDIMQCPNCTSDNEAGAKFCTTCGTMISDPASAGDAPTSEDSGWIQIPAFSMPPAPERRNPTTGDSSTPENMTDIKDSQGTISGETAITAGNADETPVGPAENETDANLEHPPVFPALGHTELPQNPTLPEPDSNSIPTYTPPQYPDFNRAAPGNEKSGVRADTPPNWVLQNPEPAQYNAPPYGSIPPGTPSYNTPPRYTAQTSSPYPPVYPPHGYKYPAHNGYPVTPASAQPGGRKKNRGATAAIVVGCIIVLLAGIILAFTNFGTVINLENLLPDYTNSNGFDNYEDLVEAYFVSFEQGDIEAISEYFLPEILLYEQSNHYNYDDVVFDRDSWYDDYGSRVLYWEMIDETILNIQDVYLDESYIDVSKITRVMNIEVEADIGRDGGTWIFDIDVVMSGGKWYLVEVW